MGLAPQRDGSTLSSKRTDNVDVMNGHYRANSLTLVGTVAMGAGIFALTGQVAVHACSAFPAAFLVAAAISAFSAYSYIKVT